VLFPLFAPSPRTVRLNLAERLENRLAGTFNSTGNVNGPLSTLTNAADAIAALEQFQERASVPA
jgi:hypothetical protein